MARSAVLRRNLDMRTRRERDGVGREFDAGVAEGERGRPLAASECEQEEKRAFHATLNLMRSTTLRA